MSMATALQLPSPRKSTPRHSHSLKESAEDRLVSSETPHDVAPQNNKTTVPSYDERCQAAFDAASGKSSRPMFVPRQPEDFDDGGAFPEIHLAQYPRQMGNPHVQKPKHALATVEVDEKGNESYDTIVKRGTNSDKIVYSKLEDTKESEADDVAMPTEAEEQAEAAKTQATLMALLEKKTALSKPSGSALVAAKTTADSAKPSFIKYTANPEAPGYNPAAAQRVIQMVSAQLDPMEPPKHEHFKAPRGPAEDPVPILHGPPPKLSKEERLAWNVPACISNWKNSRGYTIPLDKRMAADGRGLLDPEINASNFSALSESLYVAEQQARKAVRLRTVTQRKLAVAANEEKEEELRALAKHRRMERGGMVAPSEQPEKEDSDSEASGDEFDDDNDAVAARQREKLRIERKREREKELRMERNVEAVKKQRLEEERDVSEKIALGMATGTGGGDAVDSRLYNTSAGLDSGFGREDDYTAYSKPMLDRPQGSSIYRPTRGGELDADEQYESLKTGATNKFQPHKGFDGAEGGASAGPRTAPVQFEKSKKSEEG